MRWCSCFLLINDFDYGEYVANQPSSDSGSGGSAGLLTLFGLGFLLLKSQTITIKNKTIKNLIINRNKI